MPTAQAMLIHAVRMLFAQPLVTLRVILPALLVVLCAALLANSFASEALKVLRNPGASPQIPEGSNIGLLLILMIVGVLGYALMAVLWHRHVLLDGPDRDAHLRPDFQIMRAYVWRAIIVGLVQMLAAVPVSIGMGVLALTFMGIAPQIMSLAISMVGSIALIWVALRISLILPAAAVGHRMKIQESWAATQPHFGLLLQLAVLLAVFSFVLNRLGVLILPDTSGGALWAAAGVFLVEGLVFISVLTTVYGVVIENRDV